jgi:dTDP-4-dehydrorhamnose reductase
LSIFPMHDLRCLVVGSDGLIGAALSEAIRLQDGLVTGTSRRHGNASKDTLFLNLQDEDSVATFDVSGYGIAYFCAGWSKYADIETNESVSQQINVTNTLRLCARLMEAGCSVVFLSSAVFDGERPYPVETDPGSPGTRYGRQKYQVEGVLTDLEKMSNAFGIVKIVRLSKVLVSSMPLITGWRNSLARGEIITPLMDLRLSPVSLTYVVNGLLSIGTLEQSGIFHLSGIRDVTYADIARELLIRWGYSLNLLSPVTSMDSDIYLPYVPRYPSLGMTRTSKIAAIPPQLFADCIVDMTDAMVR